MCSRSICSTRRLRLAWRTSSASSSSALPTSASPRSRPSQSPHQPHQGRRSKRLWVRTRSRTPRGRKECFRRTHGTTRGLHQDMTCVRLTDSDMYQPTVPETVFVSTRKDRHKGIASFHIQRSPPNSNFLNSKLFYIKKYYIM